MVSDNTYRACDADRERVAAVLREAYAVGRLTIEEFEERTTAAFGSRTWGDLRTLTGDLPVLADRAPMPVRVRTGGSQEALTGGLGVPVLPIALAWLAVTVAMRSPGFLIPILFLVMVAVPAAAKWRAGPGPGRDRAHPACGEAYTRAEAAIRRPGGGPV